MVQLALRSLPNMTQAKAQTVVSAAIGLGYTVRVNKDGEEWIVFVSGPTIAIASATTFATNNEITGYSQEVKFI